MEGGNAPICVDSAARRMCTGGSSGDVESARGAKATGAAGCVGRAGKAQGSCLRERGSHHDAAERLRHGEMALASHYGINLYA